MGKNFKTCGVDIFIEANLKASLPDKVGNLTLKHIASRGLKLTPNTDISILDVGWLCARYTFPNPQEECDSEINELIITIGKSHRWTSLVKLFDDNGAPAYT